MSLSQLFAALLFLLPCLFRSFTGIANLSEAASVRDQSLWPLKRYNRRLTISRTIVTNMRTGNNHQAMNAAEVVLQAASRSLEEDFNLSSTHLVPATASDALPADLGEHHPDMALLSKKLLAASWLPHLVPGTPLHENNNRVPTLPLTTTDTAITFYAPAPPTTISCFLQSLSPASQQDREHLYRTSVQVSPWQHIGNDVGELTGQSARSTGPKGSVTGSTGSTGSSGSTGSTGSTGSVTAESTGSSAFLALGCRDFIAVIDSCSGLMLHLTMPSKTSDGSSSNNVSDCTESSTRPLPPSNYLELPAYNPTAVLPSPLHPPEPHNSSPPSSPLHAPDNPGHVLHAPPEGPADPLRPINKPQVVTPIRVPLPLGPPLYPPVLYPPAASPNIPPVGGVYPPYYPFSSYPPLPAITLPPTSSTPLFNPASPFPPLPFFPLPAAQQRPAPIRPPSPSSPSPSLNLPEAPTNHTAPGLPRPLIINRSPPPAPSVVPVGPTNGGDEDLNPNDILSILNAHNTIRANYQAAPLTWNDKLVKAAQQWSQNCYFNHSPLPYGENLAIGYSRQPEKLVNLWYTAEVCDYNYSKPGFTAGHFTQLVWVSTRQVGCSMVGPTTCPQGIRDWTSGHVYSNVFMLTCEYLAAGNAQGAYTANVRLPLIPYPCS